MLQNTCLFVYSVIGWEVGCLCHVSTPGLVAVASASSTQEEWDCGDTAQHTPDNNTKLKKMMLKQSQMALRDLTVATNLYEYYFEGKCHMKLTSHSAFKVYS